MANKIVYPIVGGIIKNMKGDSAITAGMKIKVDADNTVDEATGVIHGIALDAPKTNVSPSTGYTVSVLLFGNCVIAVADTMTGAVAGDFLKCTTGALVKDGAAKTADSVALLLDAANKVILIL
jgi:hypothetical protein